MEFVNILLNLEQKGEGHDKDLLLRQVDKVVDKVVDAGHGVNDGENFDFEANLDE